MFDLAPAAARRDPSRLGSRLLPAPSDVDLRAAELQSARSPAGRAGARRRWRSPALCVPRPARPFAQDGLARPMRLHRRQRRAVDGLWPRPSTALCISANTPLHRPRLRRRISARRPSSRSPRRRWPSSTRWSPWPARLPFRASPKCSARHRLPGDHQHRLQRRRRPHRADQRPRTALHLEAQARKALQLRRRVRKQRPRLVLGNQQPRHPVLCLAAAGRRLQMRARGAARPAVHRLAVGRQRLARQPARGAHAGLPSVGPLPVHRRGRPRRERRGHPLVACRAIRCSTNAAASSASAASAPTSPSSAARSRRSAASPASIR